MPVAEKKRILPMREIDFLKKFMEKLKLLEPTIWYFKVHGEPMQVRGIPDVLCCFNGLFLSLEFKIKKNGKLNITPYQEYTIEIIGKAKGMAMVVWYDERDGKVGIGSKIYDDINIAVRTLYNTISEYTGLLMLRKE